jgi:hypothetical protein
LHQSNSVELYKAKFAEENTPGVQLFHEKENVKPLLCRLRRNIFPPDAGTRFHEDKNSLL